MNPRRDDENMTGRGEVTGEGAVPAELREIAGLLDRLGAAEAAQGAAGLEGRIFAASCSMLDPEASHAAEAVEALAAHERASAGPALEGRVFVATRAYLRERSADQVEVRVTEAVRRGAWLRLGMRAAAAVVLVGAGVATFTALRPDGEVDVPAAPEVAAAQLAQQVDAKIEMVLAADWSLSLPDGMEDLSREMDSLAQQVGSEWFGLAEFGEEESM